MNIHKALNKVFLLLFILGAFSLNTLFAQDGWNMKYSGEFTKLTVFGRAEVELIPNDSQEILVDAVGLEQDQVKVSFKGGECTVKVNNLLKSEADYTLKISIGYRQLDYLSAAGGCNVFSNEIFDVSNTLIKVLSGAILEMELAGKDLEAEVAHGSQLRLIGEIESLKITANTGAQVACEGLKAIKVLAKANTGAQIDLGAGADFKLVANTGGIITYPGEPEKLDVKTSLGGEITSVQ